MGKENFGHNNEAINTQEKIKERKENPLEKKMSFLENATGNKKDFKNFLKFLETQENKILQIIENIDKDDLIEYFSDNGFPINKIGIKDFFDNFSDGGQYSEEEKENSEEEKEDSEEEKEDSEEEKEDSEEEKESIFEKKEKLKQEKVGKEREKKVIEKTEKNKILEKAKVNKELNEALPKFLETNRENLMKISLGRELVNSLEDFQNLNEDLKEEKNSEKIKELEKIVQQKLDSITNFLKENGTNLFKEIVNSPNLSENERKELFQTTKEFVSGNFSGIKIENFEFYKGNWTEDEFGTPIKLLSSIENENFGDAKISVELNFSPPSFDLQQVNSDYKFKNKLEGLSDITGEYLDKINNAKKSVNAFGNFGKGYKNFFAQIGDIWKENSEDILNGDYEDFKDGLNSNVRIMKMQYSSVLENVNSNKDIPDELKINGFDLNDFSNIQDPYDLEEKVKNFNIKLKTLGEYLQNLPKKVEEEYKEKIEENVDKETQTEKIEKQKEVLDFVHRIGLDIVPQEILDYTIDYFKNSSDTIKLGGLYFDKKNIDLKNGKFGEGVMASENQWKINLLRFYNKMIYGEPNPENSILNIETFVNSSFKATVNPTELKYVLTKKGGIFEGGGTWNKNKILQNLKKNSN